MTNIYRRSSDIPGTDEASEFLSNAALGAILLALTERNCLDVRDKSELVEFEAFFAITIIKIAQGLIHYLCNQSQSISATVDGFGGHDIAVRMMANVASMMVTCGKTREIREEAVRMIRELIDQEESERAAEVSRS